MINIELAEALVGPSSKEIVYLTYLGLNRLQGKRWDVPCERFVKVAAELLRRGWIRRRWWFWGPVGITTAGIEAFCRKESS